MVGAITFIMALESYSQIYYDYMARTIRDLLFHILLRRKSVLRRKSCISFEINAVFSLAYIYRC